MRRPLDVLLYVVGGSEFQETAERWLDLLHPRLRGTFMTRRSCGDTAGGNRSGICDLSRWRRGLPPRPTRAGRPRLDDRAARGSVGHAGCSDIGGGTPGRAPAAPARSDDERATGLSPVDPAAVDATLRNGVLHVTLPKTAEARPRKIEVDAA